MNIHIKYFITYSNKIINNLKWKPLINPKKGLEKTFLWYLHNIQYFKTIKKKDIIKRLGLK